ncbi:9529_t:CDS:2 [Rhizophagus irregularis]|nr:9529_t:CDS:2 [Rhizophagus irregularis]
MNETRFSQSYFPQHFTNRSEESKWQKSKENDIYELGRALFPMELLCQTSHQESNSRETKGISLTKPGSSEETVHEDRTKKSIPSIYDKPYIQQNKEIQAQSFSLPITSETARNNEIKCKRNKSGDSKDEVGEYDDISRGKSCPNRARIESMQASMGKLCRIGVVGSDEGTKWTSCRFVQPCYRIGRDCTEIPLHNVSESHECCNNSSMIIEIIASESNRHQLAKSVHQGPCEVSNLTECMKVKAGYGEDLYDVRNFGFNHIILVGKREYGITFLDCYGRVFELDRMSDALWPLGNSLEEAATKPWTGEVAWDVDEDGVVFEWEYYTEAERTTHDFKRADDKKPWKLEGVYKEIPDKNKSGYVEGGYVEGERIEGYVKDACVEGCVEGRCEGKYVFELYIERKCVVE